MGVQQDRCRRAGHHGCWYRGGPGPFRGRRRRRRARRGRPDRAKGHLAHSTGRAVSRGKLDRGRADRAPRPDRARHRPGGAQGLRPGHRGDPGADGAQARAVRRARRAARPGRRARHQHLRAVGHRARHRHRAARRRSSVCTGSTRPRSWGWSRWSRPSSPTRRVVEDVEALVAQVGKTDVTAGDRAGFIANALLFGYLNNAVGCTRASTPPRGHRRGDALRLRPPDGPAGPARPDRPRLGVRVLETMYAQSRDHRHAPAPLLKQYVTAGLLGRKSGRGLYTYAAP